MSGSPSCYLFRGMLLYLSSHECLEQRATQIKTKTFVKLDKTEEKRTKVHKYEVNSRSKSTASFVGASVP